MLVPLQVFLTISVGQKTIIEGVGKPYIGEKDFAIRLLFML